MKQKPQKLCTDNVCADTVVKDLCVGCGVCAGICPAGNLSMGRSPAGQWQPRDLGRCLQGCRRCLEVCPFRDHAEDEDSLARALYASVQGVQHTAETGFYLAAHAGHAMNGYRERGASGGLASWFLAALLEQDQVDHVICVGTGREPGHLFDYQVCNSPAEVRAAAKSKYYPVEISGAVAHILHTEGRYAVIGLPCTLKALRLAARLDPRLQRRLVVLAGLVCGQTRSEAYAQHLAAKAGVPADRIAGLDFRGKYADRPAADFEFRVSDARDGTVRVLGWSGVCSDVWCSGMFTPRACCFCDDVFAETADVAFMDAWLPEFLADARGASIVLTRSASAADLLTGGVTAGHLSLNPISIDRVIASQSGAIELKRTLLSHRLALAAEDEPTPRKRVAPRKPHLLLRALCRAREALRVESLRAGQGATGAVGPQGLDAGVARCFQRYARLQRVARWWQQACCFAKAALKALAGE